MRYVLVSFSCISFWHVSSASANTRSRSLLDEGWRFYKVGSADLNCTDANFSEDLSDKQCLGLQSQAQVADEKWCEATCCGDPKCEVWQWCPAGSKDCSPAASCWTGKKGICQTQKGWVSRGREVSPAPAPSPGETCTSPYCTVEFDDKSWRTVDLPHDMIIENTFSESGDKSHGYLPYSKGWYRLHFEIPVSAKGKSVWVDFDGVQRDSKTYLNGKLIGTHLSGYTSFRYDITETAIYGGSNVLAVFVDATQPDGWWYDGGGIYRHVWLNVAHPLHVQPWGVYLPATVTSEISSDGIADAMVAAETTVANDGTQDANVTVKSVIKNPNGAAVATMTSKSTLVKAGSNSTVKVNISIKGAQLWSDVTPRLYSCETVVLTGSAEVDSVLDYFGIRKMEWDKDKGFILNGKQTKVKGFANHQDFAGVGVAVPDSLQGYRVWMHKEMGANGWRTAHNPPTQTLLDECDRQGLLVWDENHRNHATPDMIEDLKSLIRRDRNHPSVIMWSLCNEALCEGFDADTAKILKPIVMGLDQTRPITAAMNGGYGSDFQDVLDVMGVNYHPGSYDSIHKGHPSQPMIGSETSSDYSDRSIYSNDKVKNYVSAYDVNYPGWGQTAEDAWDAIASRDFVSGGFYWTGFDYKGEPTPYGWPNVNSHFGVIDEAGFPKDNYFYHKSVFFPAEQKPVIHLLPHWNWDQVECHGLCTQGVNGSKTIDVWAYANGDEVELFLNEKSLGRKEMPLRRHASWSVTFAPGELRVVAYRNGTQGVFAEKTITTTGKAEAIALETEWPIQGSLKADNSDTALVTVKLVDGQGNMVPTASAPLDFSLTGPGKIIGLGNGDPSCHEHDKPDSPAQGSRSAWNGLARVVVQATKKAGQIKLQASGDGFKDGYLTISSVEQSIDVMLVV